MSSVTTNAIEIDIPPDKSIFHRILFFAALGDTKCTIRFSGTIADDVQTTINSLLALGISIEIAAGKIIIIGRGRKGFTQPTSPIDCRNSGTTARILTGILAALPFESVLIGDESLSHRPMKRLTDILNDELGAEITTSEKGTLPIQIRGRQLRDAQVALPVSSAQIKTALLLASYCSDTSITINEPYISRDHTERMFNYFGVDLSLSMTSVALFSGRALIIPPEYTIPSDISSAAFFVVAAAITGTTISLKNVLLNVTRRAALELLCDAGLPIYYESVRLLHNELVGTIIVEAAAISTLRAMTVTESFIPNLQDELPILAIAACFAQGVSSFRGASELRTKESDRLEAITMNLRKFGVEVTEFEDGWEINGSDSFSPIGLSVEHFNDHRIAMSMAIMALRSKETVTIPSASVVSISFPTFFTELSRFSGSKMIQTQ